MKHAKTWADLTTEDLQKRLGQLELIADIIRAELTRRAAGIVPVE